MGEGPSVAGQSQRAPDWVKGVIIVVCAAIGAVVVMGTAVIGGLFLLPALLYDDPLAPPFSHAKAEELVANELCPQDPDLVKPELIASQDSGTYYVYVRAFADEPSQVRASNTLALFGVGEAPAGEAYVSPVNERSAAFLASVRAACAEGRPPWPQLAGR